MQGGRVRHDVHQFTSGVCSQLCYQGMENDALVRLETERLRAVL